MQTRQHDLGDIGVNPAISPAQCRAARALLELSRADLAKAAAVGERTIADFESGSRTPIRATLAAIQRALESAGVEFLPDNGVKFKDATLRQYQQRDAQLKRHLQELQRKRAQALSAGEDLRALDVEIGRVREELDELCRYFAHHPDA
jgi:transcriptional regulator with XRE-family HTH domain